MVVDEQDLPLLTHLPEPAHDPLAAVLDAYPAAGATERIGTSIDRVGKDVMDGVVDGELPVDLAPLIGPTATGYASAAPPASGVATVPTGTSVSGVTRPTVVHVPAGVARWSLP